MPKAGRFIIMVPPVLSRETLKITMRKVLVPKAGRFIIMLPSVLSRGILRITMLNLKNLLPEAGRFLIMVPSVLSRGILQIIRHKREHTRKVELSLIVVNP